MVSVGVATKKMNLNLTTTTKKKIRSNAIPTDCIHLSLPFYKMKKTKSSLHSPESTHNLSSASCDCFRVALACFSFWTDGDARPTACFVICLKQIRAKKSVHVRTLSPGWVRLLGLGEKAESRCSYIITESLSSLQDTLGRGTGLFIIKRLLARLFNLQILVFLCSALTSEPAGGSAAEK